MRKRVILLRVAMVAITLLLTGAQLAAASNLGSVAGGGRKDDVWTVAGTVRLRPGGVAAGRFEIVHLVPPFRPTTCHYDTFSNVTIVGNTGSFDATGVCSGENEFGMFEFVANNHFTIVDNGEPGAGVDVIDVNFLGPFGIAIPGGVIDSGNFQVRA